MPVCARSCPESYLRADELLWALQIAEHLPGRASMNQSGANTAACVSHRLVPASTSPGCRTACLPRDHRGKINSRMTNAACVSGALQCWDARVGPHCNAAPRRGHSSMQGLTSTGLKLHCCLGGVLWCKNSHLQMFPNHPALQEGCVCLANV